MLQLSVGSSAVSLGVLLGTFMGGMCIGSLALSRVVSKRHHPLRVYAALELGVGVFGLLALVLLPIAGSVYLSIAGHGMPGFLLRGVVAAICLLPPTLAMGATLPAIARWVETTPRGVSWLGFFYGGNTAGAVVGCLVTGFYLLRVYDVQTTTFFAVALNVIVASIAFLLSRVTPQGSAETAADARGRLSGRHEPRLRRDRDLRDDRARRGSRVDAPVHPAARRHHLHVLDHPRRVPHRHRARQQRRARTPHGSSFGRGSRSAWCNCCSWRRSRGPRGR